MPGKNIDAEKEISSEEIAGGSYVLFLILILLIMGNQNTFDNYFEVLGKQVNGINNTFNTFAKTADGLKTLLQNETSDKKNDFF